MLFHSFGPAFGALFFAVIGVLAVWSLIWKGLALWHAARNRQKTWFVVMLILNSLGILEIVYLLFFRKDKVGGVTGASAPHSPTTPTPTASSVPPMTSGQ
jgi:hypothetical protein